MEDTSSSTPTQIPAVDGSHNAAKRKRSVSVERTSHFHPPQKIAKTNSSQPQINYLARQYSDTLPLISIDDTLPSILQLVGDYQGALERHESLAGNLGARLLGPILIKRFERLFDGPPTVLKCHGKGGTTVTWLDVVEFARHKPEQFNLEKMHDNVRVCQFYTKQSRVEISEEDFLLIASGIPQKLIPPHPVAEDEEKELGTLEILEKNVGAVIQLTDQVAARARQLNHRLKNRRNAIISRRETEASSNSDNVRPKSSNSNSGSHNQAITTNGERPISPSGTSGFVAVNAKSSSSAAESPHNNPSTSSIPELSKVSNGKNYHGPTASPATRAELLNYFSSHRDRANENADYDGARTNSSSRAQISHHKSKARPADNIDYAGILLNSASPVPIPNTPLSLQQYSKPLPADRFDDSGPYKAEMLSRMDSMQRGDRVLPPCDRCRRLHMDCLKNLTACLGCTKKHAKCSWKDVSDQELLDNPHPARVREDAADTANGARDEYSPMVADGPIQGVRDEELLGEDDVSDDGKDDSPEGDVPTPAVIQEVVNDPLVIEQTLGRFEHDDGGAILIRSNGNVGVSDESLLRNGSISHAHNVVSPPSGITPPKVSESVDSSTAHGFEPAAAADLLSVDGEIASEDRGPVIERTYHDTNRDSKNVDHLDQLHAPRHDWIDRNGFSGPTTPSLSAIEGDGGR